MIPSVPSTTLAVREIALAEGSFLLETDAAWCEGNRHCGLGWIGRNTSGSPVFKGSAFATFVPSALTGEALAVVAALKDALSGGFSDVHLKSDSKPLIDLLQSDVVVN